MAEEKNTGKLPHNLILENRKNLSVSGVSDVDSFDENKIVIYTYMGELIIIGADLHINSLNVETGDLSITGEEIDSIIYRASDHTKGSFFSKLFK